MSDKVSIIFVCLGNICRSPLAEGVFRHRVEVAGLSKKFEIDSAGTSSYHVGEAPDPGSVRVARKHGIDISMQRSRQFVRRDLTDFDLIIAMDSSNRRNILGLVDDAESVRDRLWLMRNFEFQDGGGGHDVGVPDPWGGGSGGFEEVYEIVDRSCARLLAHIREGRGL